VDRFLRAETLAFLPLHPNQHAYQAGKSVKTSLHEPVIWVEKALDQQETALGVFLDIEGAFNDTSYDYVCAALLRHGVPNTIVQWVRNTLKGCLAAATLNGCTMRVVVSRGCPQGGVY
jgi:hypothetical protein